VADTFYVHQAQQTLLQLESFDFSLICEANVQTSRPTLTSIENLQSDGRNPPTSIAKGKSEVNLDMCLYSSQHTLPVIAVLARTCRPSDHDSSMGE